MTSLVDWLDNEEAKEIPQKYIGLRFSVSTADQDRLVADVWTVGTLGVAAVGSPGEETECWVYFSLPLNPDAQRLADGRQTIDGADLLEVVEIESEDWLRVYRSRSKPFALGRGWWVDPREPGELPAQTPDKRQLLRIPARTAFGTGSHASTALLVELMEDMVFVGKRVLDVGAGTGILAMIALALGADSVTALDTDLVAAIVASETCRLNGLEPGVVAGGLHAIRTRSPSRGYDVILANVLPARLRPDYSNLAECVRRAGVVAMSGILQYQETEVVEEMRNLGFRYRSHRCRDEWVAIRLEKVTT